MGLKAALAGGTRVRLQREQIVGPEGGGGGRGLGFPVPRRGAEVLGLALVALGAPTGPLLLRQLGQSLLSLDLLGGGDGVLLRPAFGFGGSLLTALKDLQ